MPEILSLSTVEPPYVVTAEDTRALLPRAAADARQLRRLERMLPRTRIHRRHLALAPEVLLGLDGVASRAEAYERLRLELGGAAARNALAGTEAGIGPLDAIIAVSSTGYRVPSLDAYLIGELGLHPGTRRLPITELGCAAGVAGIGLAAKLAGEAGRVLVVSVELCSLSIKARTPSDSDAIGNMLFADAAAAVVVGGGTTGRGPEVVAAQTMLWPGTEELLGMRLTDAGYRLILSTELPGRVRENLRETVVRFLAAQGLRREDIGFWIIHPGGPRVLQAVADTLELSDEESAPTWRTWESHGNISSATVFFVLAALREAAALPEGTHGLMLAFGPGVTCELVLLRARGWLTPR